MVMKIYNMFSRNKKKTFDLPTYPSVKYRVGRGETNIFLNMASYFGEISGLKINFAKTQVVWIGSMKFSQKYYVLTCLS